MKLDGEGVKVPPRGDGLDPKVEMRLRGAIRTFHLGDSSQKLADEFAQLAGAGAGEAHYFIGLMHEAGTNGLPEDKSAALLDYQNAATAGCIEGYLAVARFSYFGIASPPDYGVAESLYSRVAEETKNHIACFMLGRMHQLGQGVGKDNQVARDWYLRAVDQGSMWGMLYLATLEAEEGHWARFLRLRVRAFKTAWTLRHRRPFDQRLRPS